MSQPMAVFGGSGAAVHLAVGNGFPPITYLPLMRPFLRDYYAFSLPPRPLWEPPPPVASIDSWTHLADDLLAGLNQHSIARTVGIGHSFGGTISLMAAVRAPERFRALVLLDPAIFPPERVQDIRQAQTGGVYPNPLAERALRRRSRFASVDEAILYWRTRPMFEHWPDETLRLYAQGALVPPEEGPGFVLRWSPAWEARCYALVYADAWPLIQALHPEMPLLVVRGLHSDVFVEPAAGVLLALRPQTTVLAVDGGHLFPMTTPIQTAALVLDWLAEWGI